MNNSVRLSSLMKGYTFVITIVGVKKTITRKRMLTNERKENDRSQTDSLHILKTH